ncbi:AraC family transcriptional regulator [Paenibacillus sp. MAHUQ-46]|uniref:AraC family transcriptional regulator n=2 Tax=Paenibacillus TaxID=44249 RepID=A0A934J395_9BACL|nr:AraC family transcriptional regulator [Paenibacillus roseus]MBJ6360678.1 AraC family transcriptional regulator [Paenibacillus roseus]
MTSLGGWINQPPIERPHGFNDFQWLQTTSGKGLLRISDREMTVSPGQGFLLLPNEAHAYRPLVEPWGLRWITFSGNHAAQILKDLDLFKSEVFYLSNPDGTLKHLQEMILLQSNPHPSTGLEVSAEVYALLLDVYRYGSRTELRSRKQQMDVLAPVLRYMEQHYSRLITLAELAGLLQVSPQHICVLFQQSLGVRPIEYLTRIRIRKAKELLLLQPDAEVKSISVQVGYEHPSYFIKMFKRQEGLTPTAFRSIRLNAF